MRETGAWETWIQFFLKAVITTAEQAVNTTKKITHLFTNDRKQIETLGRATASALMVHHHFQRYPINNIAKIAKQCHITVPTATKSLKHLIDLGIIIEITSKNRDRIFMYKNYFNILSEDIGEF